MEKIVPGKHVSLIYDLYVVNDDGSEKLMHQSDPEDPEKIIFGITQGVIKPLEDALDGLSKGDTFDVRSSSEESFGPYDKEAVMTLDKDMFVVNGKFDNDVVKVGKYVPMLTAEGYHINGLVLEVTDKKVKLDFNHPLAGKDIRFKGSVLDVRDATPEEIHIASGQGGCGCGGCGGGCGDNGCDSGCGCADSSDCGCGTDPGDCACDPCGCADSSDCGCVSGSSDCGCDPCGCK